MELKLVRDIQALGGAKAFKKAIDTIIAEWKQEEKVNIRECDLIINSMDAFAKKEGLISPLHANELYDFYFWLVNNDEELPKPTREIYFRFSQYLAVKTKLFENLPNQLPLKIEYLRLFEFEEDKIKGLLTCDNYEIEIRNNKGLFFASNIDGRIYTGKDAMKKTFFKDNKHPRFPSLDLSLVPEYYQLIETAYIEKQKQIAGSIFNEQAAKERFRLKEIENTKEIIQYNEDRFKHHEKKPSFAVNTIEKFTHYLQFLNDKPTYGKPNKEQKIEAPVIQLFCSIVHQSRIILKGDEGAIPFCKEVCKRFNLKYTDNVRKYFAPEIDISKRDQKERLNKVIELILPNIEPIAKQQIETYLQSKNLYG